MEVDEVLLKLCFVLHQEVPHLGTPVQIDDDFLAKSAHDCSHAAVAVKLATRQLGLFKVLERQASTAGTFTDSLQGH